MNMIDNGFPVVFTDQAIACRLIMTVMKDGKNVRVFYNNNGVEKWFWEDVLNFDDVVNRWNATLEKSNGQ